MQVEADPSAHVAQTARSTWLASRIGTLNEFELSGKTDAHKKPTEEEESLYGQARLSYHLKEEISGSLSSLSQTFGRPRIECYVRIGHYNPAQA